MCPIFAGSLNNQVKREVMHQKVEIHLLKLIILPYFQEYERKYRKPPYTYTELITQALKDQKALTVSGIYNWIT